MLRTTMLFIPVPIKSTRYMLSLSSFWTHSAVDSNHTLQHFSSRHNLVIVCLRESTMHLKNLWHELIMIRKCCFNGLTIGANYDIKLSESSRGGRPRVCKKQYVLFFMESRSGMPGRHTLKLINPKSRRWLLDDY